jgi:hypothetical protein
MISALPASTPLRHRLSPPFHLSNLDRTDFPVSAYQLLRPCVIASHPLSISKSSKQRLVEDALPSPDAGLDHSFAPKALHHTSPLSANLPSSDTAFHHLCSTSFLVRFLVLMLLTINHGLKALLIRFRRTWSAR